MAQQHAILPLIAMKDYALLTQIKCRMQVLFLISQDTDNFVLHTTLHDVTLLKSTVSPFRLEH